MVKRLSRFERVISLRRVQLCVLVLQFLLLLDWGKLGLPVPFVGKLPVAEVLLHLLALFVGEEVVGAGK